MAKPPATSPVQPLCCHPRWTTGPDGDPFNTPIERYRMTKTTHSSLVPIVSRFALTKSMACCVAAAKVNCNCEPKVSCLASKKGDVLVEVPRCRDVDRFKKIEEASANEGERDVRPTPAASSSPRAR